MKKILSLCGVASFFFVLSLASADFSDVKTNYSYVNAVYYLQAEGIINGYPDNTFKPSGTINRAELMKILVGGMGIQPSVEEYHDCFDDVKREWFAGYVCYAESKGWVGGYADGTFRPSQPVLKVEALKMLINSQGLGASVSAPSSMIFLDIDMGAWYSPYLNLSLNKGILVEGSGSAFAPDTNLSRGLLAEYLFRLLVTKKMGVEVYTNDVLVQFDAKYDLKVSPSGGSTSSGGGSEVTGTTCTSSQYSDCSGNYYNCAVFQNQSESQCTYEKCKKETGTDIHELDEDSDGTACEDFNFMF